MRYQVDGLIVDIREDEDDVGTIAALAMTVPLIQKPRSAFLLAWGDTVVTVYRKFVYGLQQGKVCHKQLIVTKGDEIFTPGVRHLHNGESFIRAHLNRPLGIPDDRFINMNGSIMDAWAECRRTQKELDKLGPFDLAILGLGPNGHLLFNEDAYNVEQGVHMEHLAESTTSRKGFPAGVTHGITCGLKSIRESRKVLVIACGEHKSGPVARLVHEEISPDFTAGILRRWKNATLLIDKAAARELDLSKLTPKPPSS